MECCTGMQMLATGRMASPPSSSYLSYVLQKMRKDKQCGHTALYSSVLAIVTVLHQLDMCITVPVWQYVTFAWGEVLTKTTAHSERMRNLTCDEMRGPCQV